MNALSHVPHLTDACSRASEAHSQYEEWQAGAWSLPADMRSIRYVDTPLIAGPRLTVARWLVDCALSHTHRTFITHINANNYYWLLHNPALRQRLLPVGSLLADGIGLKIGGLLLGHSNLTDLNGTDLFPLVMDLGRQRGLKIYLLGGRREVIHRARSAIEAHYPGISVVGCRDGYFEPGAEQEVVDSIRGSAAHVLLAGLGFVRQEDFTLRHYEYFDIPLVWNVGGLFDFLSGAKPRAPHLLRKLNLEWLYRLAREPGVMWHRSLVAAPWFLWHSFVSGLGSKRVKPDAHERL